MSHLDGKQSWRPRLGWLGGELLVVFVAVSAAFVVECVLRAGCVLRTGRASAAFFSRSHGLAKRVCRRSPQVKQYGARPSQSTRSRSIFALKEVQMAA